MPKPLLQNLVVTIYGLYAPGAPLTSGALVRLLGDLGVEAGAARSTISRLKSKGVLLTDGPGTRAPYLLSAAILDRFRDGDQRIFEPQRAAPDDPWALVVFSVPEAQRSRRYELRTELTSLGFGFMASGVAIGPRHVLDQALVRLRERDLSQFVEHFVGQYGNLADLPAAVATWWDLPALDAEYRDFIAEYAPARERPQAERSDAEFARLAYATYIPLLSWWRRFPYRDPNIPLDLLPAGWLAPRAKRLFLDLHADLAEPARRHAEGLIGR